MVKETLPETPNAIRILPECELPKETSEAIDEGYSETFSATLDYEVVGKSEYGVRVKINNIFVKPSKRLVEEKE